MHRETLEELTAQAEQAIAHARVAVEAARRVHAEIKARQARFGRPRS